MEPVYTPVIGFARTLFFLQGLKFTITGSEHIPRTGGAVIVQNHVGYFDFAYAGLPARESGRVIRFMCKDTIFEHPVSGPLMRGMKHIPVDREAGTGAFRNALKALKAGELVGVFPEATISRSFELKEFKSGAVRMAQAARVPIIPIVLWGSQRVWTKGHKKHLLHPAVPVTIKVGAPLEVPRGADVEAVSQELRTRMSQLLIEAQEAYPPLTGEDRKYLPRRLGGTAPTLEEATRLDLADAERRRAAKALKTAEAAEAALKDNSGAD